MKIKEIIVVEGKNDIIQVKNAFEGNVDVVATHGLGITQKLIDELSLLNENKGIIVLTDPDYAGKKIESIIRHHIPNAKFASIARDKAKGKSKVGVEHASKEAIIAAIESARPNYTEVESIFTKDDINDNKLNGYPSSKQRRIDLCKELSITYCNAKQLLIKLNAFGITREEFEKALSKIGD